MTWVQEQKRSWMESLAIKVIKSGPVPGHVGFIMDGNRRYANKLRLEKITGHLHGFDKLTETLWWCNDLGINTVTVYAFSIENFKRSQQEVEGLLSLAQEKFAKLLEEQSKLDEKGVCVRIFGDMSLLPVDTQKVLAEAVLATRHNNRAFLNVCFAYTSRHEIANATKELACGVKEGVIVAEDICQRLLEKTLYTRKCPDPDLIVRTSGEVRLSDFMLWQSSYSVLAFADVLWPEFTIWDLIGAVFYYQRHFKQVSSARNQHIQEQAVSEEDSLKKDFSTVNGLSFEEFKNIRDKRISRFLTNLEAKQQLELEAMRRGLGEQRQLQS